MPAMLAKGEQLANAVGETAAGNDDIVEGKYTPYARPPDFNLYKRPG